MTQSTSLPDELPAIGFLNEMDAAHRAFLASYGKFIRPDSGDTVISQGEPQDNLYLIISGKLHVVYDSGSDRPLQVASLDSGDSLGEVNVFDASTASASVYARSKCLIWKISKDEVESFLQSDPVAGVEFMRGLLKLSAHRLRNMNTKLADAIGMTKAIKAMTFTS